ncbi:P-loop containing nucleoside triphosphate hydrolase protein [Aureobasidium pullulans]|uniref:P-loop containing nucleoside triphosphate hydrolase protein n=1 Tax=Aureobasidium pullulans TaxID=5580 RepID=A0A4S9Q2L1_AURPU|nr:P-loop containing nucleoside triphosphate hydrolase protein [Aureobasidium pullulans]THZ40601.1 P-loop containing nucleoside triphosphate hydrolase protein [Aureobasidium pullulans]THZ66963.1 P-loop containing nucleoside triphosphate hydrolase protein [Aureobasidium pullulans]
MDVFAYKDGRRQSDFSIQFENIFFVIVPSCLFLLFGPWRIFWLARQRPSATSENLLRWKSVVINVAYCAIELSLLVIYLKQDKNGISITANTLLVLDAVAICILSWYEHWRSSKPSSILGVYLLFTAMTDIVRIRTLWLLDDTALGSLLTASLAIKLVMIVLEETAKVSTHREKSHQVMDQVSGIYGKSLFWWVNGVLRQGYHKTFVLPDLSSLDRRMMAEHLVARFQVYWTMFGNRPGRLILVSLGLIKWHLPSTIAARVLVVGFNICQPLLMEALLNFLQNENERTNVGYGLLAAFALVYLGMAVFNGIYYRKVYQSATTIRGGLIANIYKSTLHRRATIEDDSKALTLISADVDRVSNSMRFMHEFWAEPLQVAIATWLLQRRVGVSFVVPIIITLLTTLGVSFASRWTRVYQEKWMSAIQSRVGASSAVLSSMEALKMTGFTQSSSIIIKQLRETEIKAGKSFRWLEALTATSAYLPALLSPPITFAIFVAVSSAEYDVSRILTSLSLLQLITQPLSSLFQVVVPFVGAFACLTRIGSYLEAGDPESEGLSSEGASVRYDTVMHNDVDNGVELTEPWTRLLPVRGQRSAKPSIIIKDADIGWNTSTAVLHNLNATFSTSSFNFILGPVASGKSTLIRAILGEAKVIRGSVVSPWSAFGYCDQKPWLQSATIRKNIIGHSTYDPNWYATVLHVTCLDEDIRVMSKGDQTPVGDSGTALSGGQKKRVALARAIYSRCKALILDDPFAGFDSETQRIVSQRVFGREGILARNTDIVITTTISLVTPISQHDHVVLLGQDGQVQGHGCLQDLQPLLPNALVLEGINIKPDSALQQEEAPTVHVPETVKLNRGNATDAAVFLYYFRSIGVLSLVAFLMLTTSFAFFSVFPTIWLQWWAEAGNNASLYLGVYAGLQVSAVFCILALCSLTLVHMVAKSGLHLHKTILATAMNACWPSFITTGSADILNRLTHDLGIIDAELPELLLDLVCVAFTLIGQAILIARSNWYIAAAYVPLIGLLWAIQKIYLRTSKQLRHLELEAKAPLYRQFTETLAGLSTIRAFGWEEKSIATNNDLIDQAQRPYYLLLMVQRWLSLVLDLITAGITILVVGLAIALRDSDSTGSVGVALLNIMSFATYTRLVVVLWSSTETALGAVSRIMTFGESIHLETTPDILSPTTQNALGAGPIIFTNVSASYSFPSNPSAPSTLSNISLTIPPGAKLGICGRSGSGKSSLVKTLLRMLDISTGNIFISGTSITSISPNLLRQSITTVTQDPWFLPGSVGFNLDTTATIPHEEMIEALQKVGLWHIFASQGLEVTMNEKLLSQGQKQLFCLARACVRPKKIVILDEFTSAVDTETENLMLDVANQAFKESTVIAVAHHLNTIKDYDIIVVMDKGEIVETGQPGELLERQSSRFRDMVEGGR